MKTYPSKDRLLREMTDADLDAALDQWNRFATEWTRRETDTTEQLPSPSDDWSEISPIWTGKTNRLVFCRKSDSLEFEIKLRKGTRTWGKGLSFTRPTIPRERALRGWVYVRGHLWHSSSN
jgi:hypothetical protein